MKIGFMTYDKRKENLVMFDAEKIMRERELKDPIEIERPEEFPRNEEIPTGCIVLENLKDDWGYGVNISQPIEYVQRKWLDEWMQEVTMPLHMILFEPKIFEEEYSLPCVVFVQGSAFHQQDLMSSLSRNLRLAEKGFVVAVVEYCPSEILPFPAQMQDTKTAIRFLRKNAEKYHIDPDRIALMGDSSGGHTALMAGFTGNNEPDTSEYNEYSAHVRCIIDLYGPTVFSLMNYCDSIENHFEPDSPAGFEIGRKNVLENMELSNATIPMNYLSLEEPTPPTLIIHGGRDMLVNFDQSCLLYKYMKELGKDVTFYKIKDANHGFLGFQNDLVLKIIVDFLKEKMV